MFKLSAYALAIFFLSLTAVSEAALNEETSNIQSAHSAAGVSLTEKKLGIEITEKEEAAYNTFETTKHNDHKYSDDITLSGCESDSKIISDSSSSKLTAKAGRTITVTAYAYCIDGRTSSGSYTGRGCIAVDPNVIPLGSKIYVPGYGWGTAKDTGGSIRGNVIDVWLPTRQECYNWGTRTLKITIE